MGTNSIWNSFISKQLDIVRLRKSKDGIRGVLLWPYLTTLGFDPINILNVPLAPIYAPFEVELAPKNTTFSQFFPKIAQK